jgi:hypothetical protein
MTIRGILWSFMFLNPATLVCSQELNTNVHQCSRMIKNIFLMTIRGFFMAIHVIYSVKTTTSCLPIIVVVGVKEWRGL